MRDFIQLFLRCVEFFFILYMVGYASFLFLSVTVGSSTLYAAKRRNALKNELSNDYYVPVSVFNASMLPDHSSYFDITQIVFPDDGEDAEKDPSTFRQSSAFRTYLDELKAVSLWESPVDVNVDDKLLMLITCSYDLEDGRLMVVCRRLRDGETPEAVAGLFEKK